jgi:RNA polymerase sigma-70 factor (ECF subfamily)
MGPELRAKESASDVVQSACREVLQHVDRFQHGGEAGFRQWLFTTAFRMVQKKLAFHRAGKRDGAREQRRGSDFDDNLAAYYRTLSTPSRKLMRQEQIELLESAVSSLSEQHREVVLLSRVVGLPIKDVAKAMGRTEVATRSLLRRALSELAEIMDRG